MQTPNPTATKTDSPKWEELASSAIAHATYWENQARAMQATNAALRAALERLLAVEDDYCDLNAPSVRADLDGALAQARAALGKGVQL